MAEAEDRGSGRSEDGGDRESDEDPLVFAQVEAKFRKSRSVWLSMRWDIQGQLGRRMVSVACTEALACSKTVNPGPVTVPFVGFLPCGFVAVDIVLGSS